MMNTNDTLQFSKPYLKINDELEKTFRFRYLKEFTKGRHGGLKPRVKLHNCDDPSNIYIKASLYTNEEFPRLHTNYLYCENKICWVELSEDSTAEFPVLPIIIPTNEEKEKILRHRIINDYGNYNSHNEGNALTEEDLAKECEEQKKQYNKHCVLFCFEAYYYKDESYPVCNRIFSNPVTHEVRKDAKQLNITYLSRYSGKTTGNEDMMLLVGKIKKDEVKDIDIVFFNEEDNWEEKAKFRLEDVYYQEVAIPIQTPAFKDNVEKDVFIQLRKKSDGTFSEAKKFCYKPSHVMEPDFIMNETRKRKKMDLSEHDHFEPSTSSNTENSPDYLDGFDWDIYPDISHLQPILQSPNEQTSVTTDGLLDDLALLNINETNSGLARNQRCLSETENEDKLKKIAIKLIRESKKNSIFRLLPSLLPLKDDERNNLLHLLILEESDNLPLMLKKILEHAPSDLINQVNEKHVTPLHIAVSKGFWKVVRILLLFGANPNIKDENGNTCTHLAAMFNSPKCLVEVLAPLLKEVKRKYLPDINLLNDNGLAPLHISVKNDFKDCVKLLLEAKAGINIPDGKSGKTALHYAYEINSDVVTLLVSQPDIYLKVEDYNGNASNFSLSTLHEDSSIVPNPTMCSIELSRKNNDSNEGSCTENKNVESINCVKDDVFESHIVDDKSEDLFCKKLDSSGLWKKMGLYVMPKEEISVIEIMDTAPTKTILNLLKKQHGENYVRSLKNILLDEELKEFAQFLNI